MPSADREIERLQLFIDLMRSAGANQQAIDSFAFHFTRTTTGNPRFLSEQDISPIDALPNSEDFGEFARAGKAALHRAVVIKLNGGLGTGMGLERAKSLLEVREGLSFLDLTARQIVSTRSAMNVPVPLILMNSPHTVGDTAGALAGYDDLERPDLPLSFLQNRVPKILESTMTPAEPPDTELGWCPPGHGDLYTSIAGSGLLAQLLDLGFEYAFVANADNLGAVLDPAILGYMARRGHDFMMEAADRTDADRKGGHLCRLADGRFALRESAQCRGDDEAAFQDVDRHRFFNTNNLWLRLPALKELIDHNGGFLPLDTIVNRKHLDPRDSSSPPVLQLETAMGAAISVFENAAAIRVPRNRFSPVKNTNDLLAVRSDAFVLSRDWLVSLHPDRHTPPVIDLDRSVYTMIDDFEKRFPSGPPSLQRCERLTVEGDVTFGAGISIEGATTVRSSRPQAIPGGAVLSGDVEL